MFCIWQGGLAFMSCLRWVDNHSFDIYSGPYSQYSMSYDITFCLVSLLPLSMRGKCHGLEWGAWIVHWHDCAYSIAIFSKILISTATFLKSLENYAHIWLLFGKIPSFLEKPQPYLRSDSLEAVIGKSNIQPPKPRFGFDKCSKTLVRVQQDKVEYSRLNIRIFDLDFPIG